MDTYKVHYLTNTLEFDATISVEAVKDRMVKVFPEIKNTNAFLTEGGIRFAACPARGKYYIYSMQFSQMGEEGGGDRKTCEMTVFAENKEDAKKQWLAVYGPTDDYHWPTVEQLY